VEKDKLAAVVKLRIEVPSEITAFITREAADEMDLKEGDKAAVVIKSTEVMVSKERL
jgi:molybdate transport system regulatory protein